MATQTTATVSLEEYLHTSYEQDAEFAGGMVLGRNVGTQLHSILQGIITAYFRSRRREYNIEVFPECRLRLDAFTQRHVVPDVMVVERPYSEGDVLIDVPAIVIEIKPPGDRFDAIIDKCLEYAAFGVSNILVIDPDSRRQFLFKDNSLRLSPTSFTLHLPKLGTDIPFPLGDLYQEFE